MEEHQVGQSIQAYEDSYRQHLSDKNVVTCVVNLAAAKLQHMTKALEDENLTVVAGLVDDVGRTMRSLYLGCSGHPDQKISFHGCRIIGYVWQSVTQAMTSLDPQPLHESIPLLEKFAQVFNTSE